MLKKIKIPLLLVTSITLAFVVFTAFIAHKDEPKTTIKTIVIDPGHGGKDPGCNGADHNEKTVALAVALKLGKLIEENMKDVKVIYTRTTDVFVELDDRAKIANENKADLFISIHCNAAGKPVMIKDPKTGKMKKKTFKNKKGKIVVVETANPEPYGSETYVMGLKNEQGKMQVAQRENSAILLEDNYEKKYEGFDPDSEESYIIMSNYTSGYVINSAKLAMNIQSEYANKAGRVDKGVHRQSIWVLWRTAMPSVLTEIGYLTNPQEEKFLGSDKGQTYIASCIFRAFRKYKDDQEGISKKYNDDIENQKPLEKEIFVSQKDTTNNKDTQDKDEEIKKENEAKALKEKAEKERIEKERKLKADSLAKITLENEKRYKQAIVMADLNLKKQNYTDALNFYELADKIKASNETYPQTKIKEIKTILENVKQEKLTAEKADKERLEKLNEQRIKDSLAKRNVTVTNTTSTSTQSNEIVFKVQFAGMDKEVDVKTKFPNVNDVSFYKVGNIYKYTSGNFTSAEEASKQQAKLKELGYKDCFVVVFKNGVRISMSDIKK